MNIPTSCLGGGGYPSQVKALPEPTEGWRVAFPQARRKTTHQKDPDGGQTLCGVPFEDRQVSFTISEKVTCGNCARTREMKK